MGELVGILPCAGRGTRLFGAGYDRVSNKIKELQPVGGVPMIELSLRAMEQRGVERVILVVAPGKEQVAKYVALSRPSWQVATVYQNEPTGTGRALALVLPWALEDDTFLYLMPDSYHVGMPVRTSPGRSSLYLYCWQTREPERYGVFNFKLDGEVIQHVEKNPSPPWPGPYWAWGAAAFGYDFLVSCWKSSRSNQGSPTPEHTIDDCFDSWIWSGHKALVHQCSGHYVDMGTPEGLSRGEYLIESTSLAGFVP